MPPKKLDKATVEKKKKNVDDKTFGLKNKNKSAKVAAFVQTVQQNLTHNLQKRGNDNSEVNKSKKKAEEDRQKELADLFAVAIKQPKVPEGVDPKSIVCEFFRHGQCTKGFKCKFSHDLNADRKGPKISLFADQRELGGGEEEGGMEDWDQEKLEQAIREKHSSENKNMKTEIICKFFLDAVEKKSYGWFWKCPNGGECKYRHALPPGYILKSQMRELLDEEAANRKDMADLIEEERAKVDARTPITEKVMKEWLRQRRELHQSRHLEEELERKRKGILNGREIFLEEGFQAADDAGAADEYEREDGGAAGEEARIQEMMAQARANEAAARAQAGVSEYSQEDEEEDTAGPSGTNGAGPSNANGAGPSTTLRLNAEDAALFDGDDDDEDEEEEEEEEEDENELDELGKVVQAQHLAG